MPVDVISVASAIPPYKLEQNTALDMAQRICCVDDRQSRLTGALYNHSGVTSRYTAVPSTEAFRWAPERDPDSPVAVYEGPTTEERMIWYEENALPLAMQAAGTALDRSGLTPEQITHVVTASCTGFVAPGVDSGLIFGLGMRPTTQRINVGYMGRHGSINALRVAHALAKADHRSRILVCAVELCSLHYTFHWNSERMLGNALFADGAGALVIGATPPDANGSAPQSNGSVTQTNGSAPHTNGNAAHTNGSTKRRWRLAATGSYLFPDTTEFMTWKIGNQGFAMTISPRLPELIEENLGPWLREWLAAHHLKPEQVQSWAIHPGGPRILDAAEVAIGLTPDRTEISRHVLRQYGNMSSATVLFILEEMMQRQCSPPCVMLGFGPGLVAEIALLL